MLPWSPDLTIVQSDITIVVSWQLTTGSIHDYIFCYCRLVGILFDVLRINFLIFYTCYTIPTYGIPQVLWCQYVRLK